MNDDRIINLTVLKVEFILIERNGLVILSLKKSIARNGYLNLYFGSTENFGLI